MKSIPAALLAHYALGTTTLATAIRIERQDGEIFAFTTHDENDVIDGVTYLCDPGFVQNAISITAGCDVGNTDITTLHDGSVFTTADILGERWQNAAFLIFRYNYKSITDGIDELLAGTFGEVELRRNTVIAELHDLRRYLQHPVGDQSSKTCRYRLGDERCTKDISFSDSPFTVLFTVTNVTNRQIFQDSARGEALDFFGEGEIRWLGGLNAGERAKVKYYAADGTFTLGKPMWLDVQVGDTGYAIAGCRKRREEDCRDKFENEVNFGAEPDRKLTDDITQAPVTSV